MSTVKCSAEYRPGDDQLEASGDLDGFVSGLPAGYLAGVIIWHRHNST